MRASWRTPRPTPVLCRVSSLGQNGVPKWPVAWACIERRRPAMTSPARVLAILNLFSEERPVWHTDEINETMGYTRATGYRYVKDLVEAGFLRKVSAGRYSLGPRTIEL